MFALMLAEDGNIRLFSTLKISISLERFEKMRVNRLGGLEKSTRYVSLI